MTEEIVEAMSRPDKNVRTTLPKRTGPRTMIPASWVGHGVRIEYQDGLAPVEARGTLLDWCAMGPIFNLAGAKTVVGWDRLVLLELVEG
jgi:hypothetical protein